MQMIGHVRINGQKVLVLIRGKSKYRSIHIRKSGKDGPYLEDESLFLAQEMSLFADLLAGKSIKL